MMIADDDLVREQICFFKTADMERGIHAYEDLKDKGKA